MKTEADTPQAAHHEQKQPSIVPKFKKKCKTQGEEDFSRFEAQYSMKKPYDYESPESRKKRAMQTETGPLISGYTSHLRNYSSGQLKENDPANLFSLNREKVKKRPKAQEKGSSKMKRIEEKFLEISAKLMNKERGWTTSVFHDMYDQVINIYTNYHLIINVKLLIDTFRA